MSKKDDRPAWMSPVIHTGMVITMVSVIAGQFVENRVIELVLVGIALCGIALSMAPFWPRNFEDFWQSIRRLAKDANKDDHF